MRREEDFADCPELSGEELERHLFACPECRAGARLAGAWKALGEADAGDGAVPEAFLSRVLAAARVRRRRDRARRILLAAAAVLLFSFFAGTGHGQSSAAERDGQAEDVYASVTAPSVFEVALPE